MGLQLVMFLLLILIFILAGITAFYKSKELSARSSDF